MIVDKTRTLTEGKPVFDKAVAMKCNEEAEVLRLAASLDQGSEHPLAAAIAEAARKRDLTLAKALDFESPSGIGVRGVVERYRLALGNTAQMQQGGVDMTALIEASEVQRQQGSNVMYLARDGQQLGLLALSDPVKASTPEAVTTGQRAKLFGSGIAFVVGREAAPRVPSHAANTPPILAPKPRSYSP